MAKKKNTNAPGGSSKKGGGGGGRRSGGTFAQYSGRNEESARDALTHGAQSGKKVAGDILTGGAGYKKGKHGKPSQPAVGGIRETVKDYGKAMDTVKAGYEAGRGDISTGAGQQVGAVNTGLGKSTGAVTSGATAAKGDIGTGLTSATGNITSGATSARGDINTGLGQSTGAITTARDAALSGYDPYAAAGAAANSLYMGALGTDPGGHDAAVSAFHTSPGYEFEMNQGLDQLERRAAARGQLGSGNTSLDSITYSQGLADQEWGGWLDRLASQQKMGVDVAGKTADINTGAGAALSTLYTGAAGALSGIDTGEAAALAGLNTNAATAASAIDTGLGKDLSGLYTGAGTALSGIYGDEATNLANLNTTEAGKLSGLTTDLSGQKTDYATTMADLAYKTKLLKAQTQAGYLLSKDKTGANIQGGITGAINTGIDFHNAGKPQGTLTA